MVREFHATLAEVAAKRMLNEERIQQLQNAFLMPVSNQAFKVSSEAPHVVSYSTSHRFCTLVLESP